MVEMTNLARLAMAVAGCLSLPISVPKHGDTLYSLIAPMAVAVKDGKEVPDDIVESAEKLAGLLYQSDKLAEILKDISGDN